MGPNGTIDHVEHLNRVRTGPIEYRASCLLPLIDMLLADG